MESFEEVLPEIPATPDTYASLTAQELVNPTLESITAHAHKLAELRLQAEASGIPPTQERLFTLQFQELEALKQRYGF